MVLSDDALNFLRSSVKSISSLELLLLMKRDAGRAWSSDELIKELRSSDVVVGDALAQFQQTGLVAVEPDGGYRYRPVAAVLDQWAGEVETAYRQKPSAVIKLIFSSPDSKVQIFADSFLFRGKEDK